MNKLSDEMLKQIAEGNGHVYNHEGKAMAAELLEFRHDAKLRAMGQQAAGNLAPSTHPWGSGGGGSGSSIPDPPQIPPPYRP